MINFKLNLLLGLFIGLIVGANLLGTKITSLLGISVSVGIFMVPLMFLVTDVVAEVRGRALARQFVIIGVIVQLVILAYVFLFIALPPHARYTHNEEYGLVFGNSTRIIIASLVAFMLAQFNDVWLFHWLKTKTQGKWLWLRNNLSTMVSQAIDTLAFMFIAFYGVTPKFTAAFIITLAIPYYLFKIGFAALDTPLVYVGVKWLRHGNDE